MAKRKAQDGLVDAPAIPKLDNGVEPFATPALAPVPSADLAELPEGSGRYPVLSPLRFDGRSYGPDDPEANEVVMPRDQAEALQPLGVLGEELA